MGALEGLPDQGTVATKVRPMVHRDAGRFGQGVGADDWGRAPGEAAEFPEAHSFGADVGSAPVHHCAGAGAGSSISARVFSAAERQLPPSKRHQMMVQDMAISQVMPSHPPRAPRPKR